MVTTILRLPEVKARTGLSRSTVYLRISQGTFPAPISLGGRSVGWPATEIEQLNTARVAGRTDGEIRDLVKKMESGRRNFPGKVV